MKIQIAETNEIYEHFVQLLYILMFHLGKSQIFMLQNSKSLHCINQSDLPIVDIHTYLSDFYLSVNCYCYIVGMAQCTWFCLCGIKFLMKFKKCALEQTAHEFNSLIRSISQMDISLFLKIVHSIEMLVSVRIQKLVCIWLSRPSLLHNLTASPPRSPGMLPKFVLCAVYFVSVYCQSLCAACAHCAYNIIDFNYRQIQMTNANFVSYMEPPTANMHRSSPKISI